MGEHFKCPRCGNEDLNKVGVLNGKFYCRACITFNGQEVIKTKSEIKSCDYSLTYPLSESQKMISKQVVLNYCQGKDTLIHAVCGAGKTELVYEVIAHVVRGGGKVGFAIPRRDVVIELFNRISEVFKDNVVTKVYGGENEHLDGDIICLTCHQLYRYSNFFDLLIIDEIDAFPYADNAVLKNFAIRSLSGRFVMLSATPSQETILFFRNHNGSILTLNKRFHNFPLPVPKVLIRIGVIKYFTLIDYLLKFEKENKQVFVFVPTIAMCEMVYKFVREFVKNGEYVHSKRNKREEIISGFKEHKYNFLVTTSVLERGVTVKNLQVIVFNADHNIYTSDALIQISGRVGRKIDAPKGDVIFLVNKENDEIQKCIENIQLSNQNL